MTLTNTGVEAQHIPLAWYRFQHKSSLSDSLSATGVFPQTTNEQMPMVQAKQVYVIKCQPTVRPMTKKE